MRLHIMIDLEVFEFEELKYSLHSRNILLPIIIIHYFDRRVHFHFDDYCSKPLSYPMNLMELLRVKVVEVLEV